MKKAKRKYYWKQRTADKPPRPTTNRLHTITELSVCTVKRPLVQHKSEVLAHPTGTISEKAINMPSGEKRQKKIKKKILRKKRTKRANEKKKKTTQTNKEIRDGKTNQNIR
ncbi:hypothetical protein [Bacteroides graminisolvens]|uniref:hypothetical protein n=1 Tax=Bacteroides graminisolvens TaxID=477666 RepID=UPI0012B63D93|nr:hypothetical protein [Bacteroides graminisolvens]